MQLHNNPDDFAALITLTAREKHIPEAAVERDYFIVRALLFLSQSKYCDRCVFKGGTSLSKCYPDSIERFSEDIDMTFIPEAESTDKQIEQSLKKIEKLMTDDCETEIIAEERSSRNKSIYFWHGNKENRIKLEIGSSVRPEPYGVKSLKTYIQEYLEDHGFSDVVESNGLIPVTVNVLNVERTFLDKVMAVKRHSVCGTISEKARHIYDVTRLFQMPEIRSFLSDKEEFKRLALLTKNTDSLYLEKRKLAAEYVPKEKFCFENWRKDFLSAKDVYESLHNDLLYTDEKQDFGEAVKTFEQIDVIFESIGE